MGRRGVSGYVSVEISGVFSRVGRENTLRKGVSSFGSQLLRGVSLHHSQGEGCVPQNTGGGFYAEGSTQGYGGTNRV